MLIVGLSALYYFSQKNIANSFENRIYKESLHIREQFRLVFDKVQYDFRQKRVENIDKLDLAVDYIEKNKNYSVDELEKLLNKNVLVGKYEVFIINNKYIIEDASYKPDIGLNLGQYKSIRTLFDSIFNKKTNIDISPPKLDSASMNLKRYLVKLSIDETKLIQISYVLNSYDFIKEKYDSLKSLVDKLEINLATKYMIQNINFNDISFKKLDFKDNWINTVSFLNQLGSSFSKFEKQINKIINTDVSQDKLMLNNELSRIFKEEDKLLIDINKSSDVSNLYSITNGLFNDSDETKLIIKTTFSNESLKEEINKSLYTSILVLMTLFVLLFFVYRFILKNVTSKLLNIIKHINNNDESNEKEIIVEEIKTLQNDYNELHNNLNSEVQKNQLLLSQNKKFIADMVHQIRTPLSVIMTNTNLIELTQKDKNTKEFIDSINASINMLTNSYEDLSFVVANDTIVYKPMMLSVSQLLKNRCNFFSSIAHSRKRDIIDKIESNVNFFINEIELERMIDNNISNCIKYSKPNTSIEVSLTKINNTIKLEFISIGEEIKNQDKLFDRYYRENDSQRGSGIGLNIVKNVCDKYKIDIDITSKNSKNNFTYTLKI